jgi:TonB-dependent SusC/RagA subfamily outer membrane receptor
LAAEAVRVISLSPKWNPGIQNGSPVRTQFTLPINFALSIDSNPAKPDTVRTNKGWGFIGKPMVNALVILDGKEVKYNDLKLIDANSIKSVSILKDKDATSLYGAKGANGVIVVTTKSHN